MNTPELSRGATTLGVTVCYEKYAENVLGVGITGDSAMYSYSYVAPSFYQLNNMGPDAVAQTAEKRPTARFPIVNIRI